MWKTIMTGNEKQKKNEKSRGFSPEEGEKSLWWEWFKQKIGFKLGVKERSYGWIEITEVEREGEESVVEWDWCSEGGSWFQRNGEAYRKEQSVIRREDDVGGRARVTTYKWWGASVAGRLNGDEVVQIWRFGGGEDF